jgi:hypothetical protein
MVSVLELPLARMMYWHYPKRTYGGASINNINDGGSLAC